MALKPCRECGHNVAPSAKVCPNCGVSKPVRQLGVGGWLLLSIVGFVVLAAIIPDGDSTSTPRSPANKTERYVEQVTNVRSGPGTSYEVVSQRQPGTPIWIHLTSKDGWFAVASSRATNDTVGWIAGSLLEVRRRRSRYDSQLRGTIMFDGAQFIIGNTDRVAWTNCELSVNHGSMGGGGYEMRIARLDVDVYTVGAAQFANDDGVRFNPFSMKPQRMAVWCDQGNLHVTW